MILILYIDITIHVLRLNPFHCSTSAIYKLLVSTPLGDRPYIYLLLGCGLPQTEKLFISKYVQSPRFIATQ